MKKKILVLMCALILGLTACSSSGDSDAAQEDKTSSTSGSESSGSEDNESSEGSEDSDGNDTVALTEEDAVYDGTLEGTELSNADWEEQYDSVLTFEYISAETMDIFEGDYRTLTAPDEYTLYVVKIEAFNSASNTVSFKDDEWFLRVGDTVYAMQNGLTSYDTQVGGNKVNYFVFLVPEGTTEGTVIRKRAESNVSEGEPSFVTFETTVG